MSHLSAPLLLSLFFVADDKPTPKLPLGKETTYITEPLDKDGYLDYAAALNDRLGKGITPEKNANVVIWKAIGPRPEGGERMPAEYFKRLGMEEPPEKGEYFIDFGNYLTDQLNLNRYDDEYRVIYDQLDNARMRPWPAADYPHIAAWLKLNEKPLALVIEATKRPDYYHPLITRPRGKDPGLLLEAPLTGVQKCRELAKALAARATLRVKADKFDKAWTDVLACHRLGRLAARGGTLISCLAGIAIDQMGSDAALVYLERAGLTARQIQNRHKDLQGLPAIPALADKLDLDERFIFLDSAQSIQRDMKHRLEDSFLGGIIAKAAKDDPEVAKKIAVIDWEPAFRDGKKWFDRMVAAHRCKDRVEREKELDQIEADVHTLHSKVKEKGEYAYLMRGKDNPKEAGKLMGDVLIVHFQPATRKLQQRYDRSEQVQRNLYLAFALAAYHSDNNRYPAKLDDLAPKYLPAVPDDLFSGKPLIYRVTEKGYLFFSVGVNGKDEDGRSFDDDPAGDDLLVRMPLPERKGKK